MANYVKFVRGSQSAYNAMLKSPIKPVDDTLYFITDDNGSGVTLYLGTKIVASGGDDLQTSSIDALQDVIIDDWLNDRSFLIYDESQKAWVNASIEDLCFVGATKDSYGKSGLVPEPMAGDTASFLRSDGNWARVELPEQLSADGVTISIDDDTIKLHGYGVQYYRYVAETETEMAHYELQVVDNEHPWIAGLEPRVALENDKLILAWYEPNPATIDGVASQIVTLSTQVNSIDASQKTLNTIVGTKASEDASATGIFAELDKKANIEDIYTSEQVDTKIQEAVAAADHLQRVIVESVDKIDVNAPGAERYIFMVPSGLNDIDNKYYEYIVVNTNEGKSLERVGSWAVNLEGYATKEDLDKKVDKAQGSRLITDSEVTKLANIEEGAQKNIIKSVSPHFNISKNGQLTLVSVPDDLNLDNNTSISNLNNAVFNGETGLIRRVTNLETCVGNFVPKDTFNTIINDIDERLTWQTI